MFQLTKLNLTSKRSETNQTSESAYQITRNKQKM